MTTKQLSFKSLPAFPILEEATSPNLGSDGVGAWAWSTSLVKPMYWGGTKWLSFSNGTGGTGNSLSIQAVTINVPVANYDHVITNVIVPNVIPASRVNAWLAPNAEWDGDDLVGYAVTAVPKIGSIDFCLSGVAPLVGNFDIYYFWS